MLIINNCSEIFSKANDLSLHLRLNAVINVNSVKCVELKNKYVEPNVYSSVVIS